MQYVLADLNPLTVEHWLSIPTSHSASPFNNHDSLQCSALGLLFAIVAIFASSSQLFRMHHISIVFFFPASRVDILQRNHLALFKPAS